MITVTGHNSSLPATYYHPIHEDTRIVCGARYLEVWYGDDMIFRGTPKPAVTKTERTAVWTRRAARPDEVPPGAEHLLAQGRISVWQRLP